MDIPHLNSMISQIETDYQKYAHSCNQLAILANEWITIAHEGRSDIDDIKVNCYIHEGSGILLEISYYKCNYGYKDLIVSARDFFDILTNGKLHDIEIEQLYKIMML